MNGLPTYVWDLLSAAKMANNPPINATPADLAEIQQRLGAAVIVFEARMPLKEGYAVVSDAPAKDCSMDVEVLSDRNPMAESETRCCASCCSFDNGFCNNGVAGPISAGACCADHQTQAEFDADVRALRAFRVAIGLPADRPNRDDGNGGQLVPA